MFGKKKKEEEIDLGLAQDRLVMKKMENNDIFAKELVLSIKDGIPCVINFRDLPDPDQANKYLYFLEGAVVALDGKTLRINEFTYLFARKEDFLDGSLIKWYNSIPQDSNY